MAACKLTMLGGFALTSGNGNNIALPTRKDRLLLSYLALNAGQALCRAKSSMACCGLIARRSRPAAASGNLSQHFVTHFILLALIL